MTILPAAMVFSRSVEAGRMWNWMSGSAKSGRDLQNAATCAADRVRSPRRSTAYFTISPANRAPRVSSFTDRTPGFSRHCIGIM